MNRPASLLLAAAIGLVPLAAASQDRPAGLAEAEAAARAALGSDCDMNGMPEVPIAGPDDEGFGHAIHRFTYRASYQSADEPPVEVELFQLFCGSGAYNVRYAFATKRSDEEKPVLVSFATPSLGFDYADAANSRLKAPPTVRGYDATAVLVNATYDAGTMTITSHGAWRGIGDAWDSGTWTFIDGRAVLTRFEVDPTYDDGEAAAGPESYVVYDAGR